MQLKEFCQATGATHRQINYWSKSIWLFKGEEGSELPYNQREYNEDLIPRVQLMVKISNAVGGYFSVDTLKKVFDNYYERCLILDEEFDIVLEW